MRSLIIAAGLSLGVACSGVPCQAQDKDAQKGEVVLLYTMQMAAKACKWDSAKLDAKIAASEASLKITDAEKTEYRGLAEQSFKATPEDCDPKGLARTMYDEAIK